MAYIKQNWNNLPDTTTPINAERMGHIEDGIYANANNKLDKASVKTSKTASDTDTYSCNYIESLKGEVLYESDGVNDSFALTKSANGYKYIEVYYKGDNVRNVIKFNYESGAKFATTIMYTGDENNYQFIFTSTWVITDNGVTRISSRNNYISNENVVGSYGSNPYILIYKVIGYK